MRKRKHMRRCWYCYGWIETNRPKTFVTIERTYWGITKNWLYHTECWTKKRDGETMRKYKERLRQWV